jgi:5'-nucleotidase
MRIGGARAVLAPVLAIALVIGARWTAVAQHDDPGSPRARAPLTILQLNDVYSIGPVENGATGGLARVATLKQSLAAAGRTPLMMIAGDFLSSSVESTVFKGEQMIAALNAAGLDVATLGNHEFDFGMDVLLQRMSEAKFQWVVSNVVDRQTGKPVGGAPPYLIRTFGQLKVGVIGLCLTTDGINDEMRRRLEIINPLQAAAKYLPALQAERVNAIIALTHLSFSEDRALAGRFPQIDLIVGGHEHYPITAVENRTLISKAGSDAKFVARIDLNPRPGAPVERFYELIPITPAFADEPKTAAVVESYASKMSAELNTVIGRTAVPLDGVALHLRAGETNLGDFVADAIRADAGADIGLVNSGGIRGDRIHPAGPITRRTVIEIHPFGNVVCKISIPGRVLLAALNHGVARLPVAAGQFPQVSGIEMRVDPNAPAGDRLRDVKVQGRPLDPAATYTLALPDFVLRGGDGYAMFNGLPILTNPESGNLMAIALERFIAARESISPQAENRITIRP